MASITRKKKVTESVVNVNAVHGYVQLTTFEKTVIDGERNTRLDVDEARQLRKALKVAIKKAELNIGSDSF